jgi:hypothetical protein
LRCAVAGGRVASGVWRKNARAKSAREGNMWI